MSEDAHNPDGSPPSCVRDDVRAAYWEKRAKRAEKELAKKKAELEELTRQVLLQG